MKIFSNTQIRQADQFTIINEPISSVDLMERASTAFVKWLIKKWNTHKPVYIFCGPGNNGGDGLAVGRMLLEKGYTVEVYIVKKGNHVSDDFRVNLERFSKMKNVVWVEDVDMLEVLDRNAIIVDAMFGSGLTRPLEGIFARVVEFINNTDGIKVSIDIASGLFSDQPSLGKTIVKPDYTVSFQVPKLAFMMPENALFTGEWVVVDIGLDSGFMENEPVKFYYVDFPYVQSLYQKRQKFAHKGDFGKALIVAGSLGKMGAAVMCAHACMRSGAGLVTMHIPGCGYQVAQTALPEAMVIVDKGQEYITKVDEVEKYDVVGVGPGIGTNSKTKTALEMIFRKKPKAMVLDADAINILAKHKSLLEFLPENAILTPHLREFERLVGKASDHFQRIEMQKEFAHRHQVVLVLKGAHTCIATPGGEIYFNSTGNPGMASGGTGDVLTGVLTGLLAQGYDAAKAAILGVYLHGLAGDLAVEVSSQEALIASDLIQHLGIAYRRLRK
jgi:ADP-dependent NAD(P)H-hydrate dehydratase / NAD(P)H-hydrate epimerase